MNFYPTYDETYYEHNERPFHPTPERHECACGAELTQRNLPMHCDYCGEPCCAGCIHICQVCGREGCDKCQVDTGDGWQCNGHATELDLMNIGLDAIYEALSKESDHETHST